MSPSCVPRSHWRWNMTGGSWWKRLMDGRELEMSVLGNDQPIASVAGEIVPCNEFYDYNAKYVDDDSELIIPADLSPDEIGGDAGDCDSGISRAGSGRHGPGRFLSRERSTDRLLLNEVNTIPWFHIDQHVPDALGGERHPVAGAGRSAGRAGSGSAQQAETSGLGSEICVNLRARMIYSGFGRTGMRDSDGRACVFLSARRGCPYAVSGNCPHGASCNLEIHDHNLDIQPQRDNPAAGQFIGRRASARSARRAEEQMVQQPSQQEFTEHICPHQGHWRRWRRWQRDQPHGRRRCRRHRVRRSQHRWPGTAEQPCAAGRPHRRQVDQGSRRRWTTGSRSARR